MRTVEISCPIDIVPEDDGEGDDGGKKSIVMADPNCGEVLIYKMDAELAKKIAGLLKMGNKALVAKREEEIRQQQAQQMLLGGVATGASPKDADIAQQIANGRDPRRN